VVSMLGADPAAETAGLPRHNAVVGLHVVVGADGRLDAALDFAHRLDLRLSDFRGDTGGIAGLLQTGDHPRAAVGLDVVAESRAVGGLVVERLHVLTFQHTGEVNSREGVGLPSLQGIGHLRRLGEGRRFRAILGFEDGEEVGEIFTIPRNVVSSSLSHGS